MKYIFILLCACLSTNSAFLMCNESAEPKPPIAERRCIKLDAHGISRIDPYYWMRYKNDPKVLNHLQAENAYTEAIMKSTESLQEKLYLEMKGRIKENLVTLPYTKGNYSYYTKYLEGAEYPIYMRSHIGTLAESIILDVNQLAEGHPFYSLSEFKMSPHEDLVAYAYDTKGNNLCTLSFKNLLRNEELLDKIEKVSSKIVWANDNKTLYYVKPDPVTLRDCQVWKHILGQSQDKDELVFEEQDVTYSVHIYKTSSEKFIMICSSETTSSEIRYIPANQPEESPRIFEPRSKGHEYTVDHLENTFYIRSNRNAPQFFIASATEKATSHEAWNCYIQENSERIITGFKLFNEHIVVSEKQSGQTSLHVYNRHTLDDHYIHFQDQVYTVFLGTNPDPNTTLLRCSYTSYHIPPIVYEYDMNTREKKVLKQLEMQEPFDSSQYHVERIWTKGSDNTPIPISLVYKKALRKPLGNPLLLEGYGAYEISMWPYFSETQLSLLDRGFIIATAHIRGGGEFGRPWYDGGRLFNKKNTFTDFIAAAETLIEKNYTTKDLLVASGGSAGGLLIGAVVNARPDLFKAVIAHVPFVDIVTTMQDPSIPLTTGEYDEWGNPDQKAYFEYMLSYSPYDNVQRAQYPHMLITAGFNDAQVQYWEPAKWVAKLRSMNEGSNLILFKINMEAGHQGNSGRYQGYSDIAFDYAFILKTLGIE